MINTDGNILDKLTDSEYFLLSILANYGKKSHPKNDVLLSRTKWGMQKLQAVKKELILKGFLIVNSRTDKEKGGKGSNEYIVNTKLLAKYNGNQLHEFHVLEIQLDENRVHEIQLDENRVIENRVHENHTIYKVLKVSIIETLKELLKNEIIESGGKKEPTHQNISEIDILKKQNETLLLEIELLKAEKEKEKKVAAKKEKESNEPPPHKTDVLQGAWYSADESNNFKPYQLKIKDYPFKNWSKELKEAFDAFCEGEYDRSNKKFSGTQAKELIRVVEMDLDKHGTEKVENCLRLCALRQWAYEIDYQLNREKRQIEDSKPKNNNKKPLHNNDLVMKGESLNYLNKWNKAK